MFAKIFISVGFKRILFSGQFLSYQVKNIYFEQKLYLIKINKIYFSKWLVNVIFVYERSTKDEEQNNNWIDVQILRTSIVANNATLYACHTFCQ